jgi:D-sedoheptulose 7-phosphate isomerase
MNPEQLIHNHFSENASVAKATESIISPQITQAALCTATTLSHGKKVLICGNGGSASDAQHFSAELVCRYERERKALAAIALSSNAAVMTATGNDYNFSRIFSRQVEALGQAGDLLVAISTSGRSENIILAAQVALAMDMQIIALTGNDGGQLATLIEGHGLELRVPSNIVSHVQEVHAIIIHCICNLVELHTMDDLLS